MLAWMLAISVVAALPDFSLVKEPSADFSLVHPRPVPQLPTQIDDLPVYKPGADVLPDAYTLLVFVDPTFQGDVTLAAQLRQLRAQGLPVYWELSSPRVLARLGPTPVPNLMTFYLRKPLLTVAGLRHSDKKLTRLLAMSADKIYELAAQAGKPVMLFFTARWCSVCPQQEAIVNRLRLRGWPIGFIDIDKNQALGNQYGVTALPTTVLLQGERVITHHRGLTDEQTLSQDFKEN
jgi:thiol-disulfide isomerase/thioredoxin